MTKDTLARVVEQWGAVHPDLDTRPMAVIGRVHRLSRAVAAQVEDHFRASGVNRGDYDVLASLRRAGGSSTPGELAAGLVLSSAGMTGRLDRLERSGLLRRRPDPRDGRGVIVELTGTGREIVDRLVHEDMERQAVWLDALSEREQARLIRLLRKLADAVEA